jgi:hypothetical protein
MVAGCRLSRSAWVKARDGSMFVSPARCNVSPRQGERDVSSALRNGRIHGRHCGRCADRAISPVASTGRHSMLTAALPSPIDPATYFLLVSRGNGAMQNATFAIAIGVGGPQRG